MNKVHKVPHPFHFLKAFLIHRPGKYPRDFFVERREFQIYMAEQFTDVFGLVLINELEAQYMIKPTVRHYSKLLQIDLTQIRIRHISESFFKPREIFAALFMKFRVAPNEQNFLFGRLLQTSIIA
jgi:hypothetical protein